MSKFKVGDMVVIANPWLNSQECYRGFVRRIHSIDGWNSYYFEDIKDEDGDMVPWKETELEKIEVQTTLTEIDSVNALRYCMNDLITTNNCCEKIKEEKYMSDIMKIYENKKRNEVLELWYEKKKHKIIDKYDKLEEEFNKKQYSVVESFNELVEQFNKDLDGLFQFDKASEQFVLKENAPSNVYKYKIDYDKLEDEFVDKYIKKRNKELNKVEEEYAEIKAQLSLSDGLDYQIEILNRYGILNKKTKKISD